MDQKADKIHLTPLGDHWDVEAESGKTRGSKIAKKFATVSWMQRDI
jgi:hypothetical protein